MSYVWGSNILRDPLGANGGPRQVWLVRRGDHAMGGCDASNRMAITAGAGAGGGLTLDEHQELQLVSHCHLRQRAKRYLWKKPASNS